MLKWLLSLMVSVALLVGAVGGVLAQEPDEPVDDALSRLAGRLDMSRTEFLEALLEGQTLKEVAASQGVDVGAEEHGPTWLPVKGEVVVETVAQALDMTVEDLRAAMREGNRISDLVSDAGLDVDAVAAEIKAAAVARINEAVADGKLDASRAEALSERIEETDAVEAWLSGERHPGPTPRQLQRLGRTMYRWFDRRPGARQLIRPFPRLR